ncbi:MAG: c-type cytochrome, partial [Thiotrichaceae bacterium]|nr:c-type cytochrome [Thiotrichaceae bacterium]
MQFIKQINRALLIIPLLLPSITFSADIDQGKQKASMCVRCHGINGLSSNPQWPNLAGQKAAYLRAQLRAFNTGTRKNTTMQSMVASLSED